MKHIHKADIAAMRRNIIWFTVYAFALVVVMFDVLVWRV